MAIDQMDIDKPKDGKAEKKVDGKKKKDEEKEAELSDEDQELKRNLDLMVERASDPDPGADRAWACKVDGIRRELRLMVFVRPS